LILDTHEEGDAGHGRIERRKVWITPEIEHLGESAEGFKGLAGVAKVEATREVIGGKTSVESRYF